MHRCSRVPTFVALALALSPAPSFAQTSPDKDATAPVGESTPPAVATTSPSGGAAGSPYIAPRLATGWTPPPKWRFVFNNLIVARMNPLGLEDQLRFGLQMQMYKHDSPALRDNFLFFGFYPKLNPAYLKAGPSIEIQPLSIFNLRLAAEVMHYFGTFGYALSRPSPMSDYTTSALGDPEAPNNDYATTGVHVMIEPTLQIRLNVGKNADGEAKYGYIAVRDKLAAEYWNMTLHDDDRVFYDATLDTLVSHNGWILQNDLDVVFITKVKLTVGARYTLVKPFYEKTDFLSDAEAAAYADQNRTQRLGPVFAYTFHDRGYTSFNKPTLLLIAQWWLEHRYRTGEQVSQGIPYVILAFSFQSDVLH